MTTYQDAIDFTLSYLGDPTGPQWLHIARQAVHMALNNIQNQRLWSYYYRRYPIVTNAAQTTGTVSFDFTGGAYERMLTLADATWPTWAPYGMVRINNVPYEVAEYKSTTIITLSENSNPGADVAAGATYSLYREAYPLPTDFVSLHDISLADQSCVPGFVHPSDFLLLQQSNQTQGTPTDYTIMGDPSLLESQAIFFYPPPDSAYTFQAIYTRAPRRLRLDDYSTGTVTNSSTTITGVGTAWTSNMAGSVIRFSANSLHLPTGIFGVRPYHLERTVMSVESATSLTIDAALGESLAGVKYRISDPLDVAPFMLDLVRLECFKQARTARRVESTDDERREYDRAWARAHETDGGISSSQRAEMGERFYRYRDVVTSSTIT